jgi:hypothetical protein
MGIVVLISRAEARAAAGPRVDGSAQALRGECTKRPEACQIRFPHGTLAFGRRFDTIGAEPGTRARALMFPSIPAPQDGRTARKLDDDHALLSGCA